MKSLLAIISLFFIVGVNHSHAQYSRDSMSLEGFAPIYDCNIYKKKDDRNTCFNLQYRMNVSWESNGYAVDCWGLREPERNQCLYLADRVLFNKDAFSCKGRGIDFDRCRMIQSSYMRGQLNWSSNRSQDVTRTVVDIRPIYREACDPYAYDRAYHRWLILKRDQERRGTRNTLIGIGMSIGGAIMSTSDNRIVRGVGTVTAISGNVLMVYGLVQILDAELSRPHMSYYCNQVYVGETRRVIVEERECVSTRYSERGNYSRSYYEVNCNNRTYVTYERFEPWESGYRY